MSKLHSIAISSLTVVALALIGCGASGPPPRPAEVAMDPSTGGSSNDSTSTTAASTPPSSSDDDPSAAMAGATDPSAGAATPTPTSAADTPDAKPGKGGKGKKGSLSKGECQQLSDKGMDLKLADMGITDPSQIAQAKAAVGGNVNLSGMISECMKSQTRAQYTCGIAATTEAAWETCLK